MLYRTEMFDAGILMPAASASIPMPRYAELEFLKNLWGLGTD
jgi:hypothetical protein